MTNSQKVIEMIKIQIAKHSFIVDKHILQIIVTLIIEGLSL